MGDPGISRSLRFTRAIDLVGTLSGVLQGPASLSGRVVDGVVWRATRSPAGPCTIRLELSEQQLDATAWGDGAEAALDALPSLVGAHDDDSGFEPRHEVVARAWDEHRGVRVPRSGAITETLITSVLEQRVTAFEASRAQVQIVERYSERAPGPTDLWLPPDPEQVAGAASYDLHLVGVEHDRADTVKRVAASARRLDALSLLPPAEAHQRLRDVAGVGPWSAARVALVALGDADAVPIGDPHLASDVTHALIGQAVDDDGAMLEALEPYEGHRGRVIRLLEAAGVHAPERPPRYAPGGPGR